MRRHGTFPFDNLSFMVLVSGGSDDLKSSFRFCPLIIAVVLACELVLSGFVSVSPWLHSLIEHHGDGIAPHAHWHGSHSHAPDPQVVRKSTTGRRIRGVTWREADTSHSHPHHHSHDEHSQGDNNSDHQHIGLTQLLGSGLLDIPGDVSVPIPLNLSSKDQSHSRPEPYTAVLVTIQQAPRPPPSIPG